MNKLIKLHEVDCIFLSYDEPNAEYNWADLLSKVPWAKRVHGVKGSDAAHKACADLSETEHFITVDGDNIVDPEIMRHVIDFSHFNTGENSQLSWSARNHINGLIYGNGGIKCWTREHVWNMRTHEAAEDATNQVDFCWNKNYHHMQGCYSIIYNNASALQAFRAGFREGVKMSLINGIKFERTQVSKMHKSLPEQNYQRLLIWCSVGNDVKNGDWAVYGARLGCYMTNLTNWDFTQVKDFEYLNQLFEEQDLDRCQELGAILRKKLNLPVVDLDAEQSNFFKTTYQNMPRSNRLVDFGDNYITQLSPHTSYDIVFISNGEANAEKNFNRLQSLVGHSKKIHRVKNVQGIYQAHLAAARMAQSQMFYVVDADAWIVDTFDFEDKPIDTEKIYVYYSINPVNSLCYGYGGVKLFPKHVFDYELESYVDMTTSLADIEAVPEISCITRFDTGEFDTWRSAFRESAKLVSQLIKNNNVLETSVRLDTWTSEASGTYAEFCLKGAQAGKEFGTKYHSDPEKLSLINDYNYLKELFEQS